MKSIKITRDVGINHEAFADDLITEAECTDLVQAKKRQLEYLKVCIEWAKRN